jgi:tetratricopeptide (TPR) repeat protein
VGYGYFRFGQFDESIRVFQKNVREYPQSSNVYDSLGEAYAAAGKKDLAIANYEKSIQLDPKNEHGIRELKKLKGE